MSYLLPFLITTQRWFSQEQFGVMMQDNKSRVFFFCRLIILDAISASWLKKYKRTNTNKNPRKEFRVSVNCPEHGGIPILSIIEIRIRWKLLLL